MIESPERPTHTMDAERGPFDEPAAGPDPTALSSSGAAAGEVPRGAGRLIASSRMAAAVDTMRQTHDIVILDTPALLNDTDALMLSDLADGIIFVVRSGVTAVSQMNKAIDQLDEDKIRGI